MRKGDFSGRVMIKCPCGKEILEKKSHAARTKYCSKDCLYKYRMMPKNRKKYVIVNPKGKTGPNNSHYLYKGENVCYVTLHSWVRRHKGNPLKCEHCRTTEGRIQWANRSHDYKRDLNDWIQLCIKCHRKHDLDEDGNKRTDTKRFELPKRNPKTPRKLSSEQIIEIFISNKTQPELAKEYGVKSNYISRIKSGIRCSRLTKKLKTEQ